jgi:hypothetical protein
MYAKHNERLVLGRLGDKKMAVNALIFDTLAYAKKLEEAGFTDKQAEIQVETLASLINDNIATKYDIKELEAVIKESEAATKRDIKELEATTKRDIKELEMVIKESEAATKRDIKELERDIKELDLKIENVKSELKRDMELLKRDIIIKLVAILGSMIIGGFGILGSLTIFLHK